MKSTLRIGLLLCAVVLFASCRHADYQTRTIHVPAMKNQECAKLITNALMSYAAGPNLEGSITNSIEVDLENRVVTVRYDSMKTEIKNLEHHIASLGFQANEIPANPDAAAKLPAECR